MTSPAQKRFEPPIPVPKGPPLRTIGEAVRYIERLPKSEQAAKEWEDAMRALLVVIQGNGPAMFARMGIARALSRNDPPRPQPKMKRERSWMRRKPV